MIIVPFGYNIYCLDHRKLFLHRPGINNRDNIRPNQRERLFRVMDILAHQLIRRILPYLVLLGSILVLGIVILLELWPFVGPAIGVVIGSVLAIALLRTSPETSFPLQVGPEAPLDWRLPASITTLYVASVFVSYRLFLHTRPPIHYVLFSGIVAFIAYQIHRGQPRTHVLSQLCIVAFTTYWSSQLAFPAGMRNQDTPELLEGFSQIQAAGKIIKHATRYDHTPVQPIQAVQYLEILGMNFLTVYNLIAVLALTGTIIFVGVLDRALPSISRQTALYAALFFAFMSFTLNRGHIPNKINFFMPLTIIVVLLVLFIVFTDRDRKKWILVGLVSFTTLILGHDYSAGVTMIIVAALLGYGVSINASKVISYTSKRTNRRYFPFALCLSLVIMFIGYALGTEGVVLQGIGSIAATMFLASGETIASAGSTGQYAELDLELLLFATAVETFIFIFGIAGLVIILRKGRHDLDAVAFWIITGFSLIGLSLVIGAAHLPPHRIYSLLGLFGLNLTIAITLQLLSTNHGSGKWRSIPSGAVVVVIVCTFAVFSLASPIAAMPMSPLTQEMPHDRHYETVANNHGIAWIESYGQTEGVIRLHLTRYTEEDHLLTMIVPHREMAVVETGTKTAIINRDEIDPGTIYMYSKLGEETGIHAPVGDEAVGDERTLGGREFYWLEPNPDSEYDDLIYTNGETTYYNRTTNQPST